MEIKGKVALVLGGAKGIGKAVGISLAEAAAHVIYTYHDWPEETEQTKKEFAQLGKQHVGIKIDLRDPGQIENLVHKIKNKFGELHILFNNIERGGMPVIHGPYTQEQWELEQDTTLKAKWFVFHHALPLLKKAEEGVVINVSSIAGIVGRTGPAGLIFNDAYAAANRAIQSFTETWAREASPTVRVNELMLGFFGTRHAENTKGWGVLTEEQKKALVDHIPLGRTGRIDDIVKAVFFLIKDAPYMTGSVMRLDGGYILGGEHIPPMPSGIL